MKNKKFLIIPMLFVALVIGTFVFTRKTGTNISDVQTVEVKKANSQTLIEGDVESQNQATLHFQTGGKLTYLPFKEGDAVYQGQTIAQLDTYTLQRQLTSALNNYRSTRDTFDQTKQNSDTGVLQGQQRYGLEITNKVAKSGQDEVDVVNDIVKRILDQNQANLDNSVINVELANYALQFATLTSPINGVITHEDVTVPNQNITTQTSFVVSDPNLIVFTGYIPESEISLIRIGAKAAIRLSGLSDNPISGVVDKIYPQKIQTSNGKTAYKVDIKSGDLTALGKFGQTGSVLIENNVDSDSVLIPNWTVLQNKYVWVLNNDKPELRTIEAGKTIGEYTEVKSGLTNDEKIILDPKSIVSKYYIYE
ncbi:MAG: efflux RND transporter periplasmic adaptor subunit [Patescibacteria group bacterium]|nr:efflux RND transporter periplasmic adaptor subunit [Patescibacteria group bacterium]